MLLALAMDGSSSTENVRFQNWAGVVPHPLNCSLESAEWDFSETLEFALSKQTWLCSVLGTVVVGLSGVFPLLVIPICDQRDLTTGESAKTLRLLLSFAVGSLLGDVFIHQLPEAWMTSQNNSGSNSDMQKIITGLWVLAGVLVFTVLEMIFQNDNDENQVSKEIEINCINRSQNKNESSKKDDSKLVPQSKQIKVSGYLNLLNNCVDNFMHGLAVSGGFLVSFKMGVVTTIVLLIHEVPHEIGDFAILLRSGFSRWEAAKAQMMTASVGLIGAFVANISSPSDFEHKNLWVVPFTAGGFLHIALVNLLPELIAVKDKTESIKQICGLFAGIAVIFLLTLAL